MSALQIYKLKYKQMKLLIICILLLLTTLPQNMKGQLYIGSGSGYSLSEDETIKTGMNIDFSLGYYLRNIGISLSYTNISNPIAHGYIKTGNQNHTYIHEDNYNNFNINGLGIGINYNTGGDVNESGLRIEFLAETGIMFFKNLQNNSYYYDNENDILLLNTKQEKPFSSEMYFYYGFRFNYGLPSGLNLYLETGHTLANHQHIEKNNYDVIDQETGALLCTWNDEKGQSIEVNHFNLNLGVSFYFTR